MTTAVDLDALMAAAEDAVRTLTALGADEAEAFAASGWSVSVELERDMVRYTTTDADSGLGLRVVMGGRVGFAYTSEPARVEETGRRAMALSRLAPATGYSLPHGPRDHPVVLGLHDGKVAAMEAGEAVEMARGMVDACKDVHPEVIVVGGATGFGEGAVAIASSEGTAVSSRGTSLSASAFTVLKERTMSTGFDWRVSRARDVDAASVGEAAARLAVASQAPSPLETGGEMTLLLRPTALTDLLSSTLVPSIIGDAAQRGESAYTGRVGEDVAAPSISVVDDPLLPGGLASTPSDDEGVPSRRNVIIDGGRLEGFLYDSFTANQYGVETTASASRGGWRTQPDADVSNLVATVPSRASLEDLVAEVDRGVLVHDLMGAHTANRQTLDFSVSSSVVFEVRRGELVGSRDPVMVGGNVGRLLQGVIAGGGDPQTCPMGAGVLVLPWVATEGSRVTP